MYFIDPLALQHGFFVVSVRKLTLMNFFTLGLYGFYWTHRNWCAYRMYSQSDISPALRTCLAPLFLYSLMRKIDSKISATGRYYCWSPLALRLGMVFISVGTVVLLIMVPESLARDNPPVGRWGNARASSEVLLLYTALPVLYFSIWLCFFNAIQKAVNFCEGDPEGKENSEVSEDEKLLVFLGIMFWVAYAFVLLFICFFWSGMRGF